MFRSCFSGWAKVTSGGNAGIASARPVLYLFDRSVWVAGRFGQSPLRELPTPEGCRPFSEKSGHFSGNRSLDIAVSRREGLLALARLRVLDENQYSLNGFDVTTLNTWPPSF